MPIPSRVLASGNSPLATISICGDGAAGLVATGASATDALQLSAVYNAITTSAGSTGVKLPPTEAGAVVFIRNDSGQTITIYPATGSTINAAAASVTIGNTKAMLLFAITATTWASILTA